MRGAGRLTWGAAAAAALTLVWSWPIALRVSTHLPGPGVGDNVQFLWNFWWMRTALSSGLDFFYTQYLFAPTGSDLTLHTHTALPALAGATLLAPLPVLTALNVTTLAALLLNGLCAYLLAWRITGDRGAALLAGMIFGGSPYIAGHLNGHFNLTSAWTIPLLALTASEAVRGSVKWSVLSGLILAATAYIDYYYVVYELALMLCIVAVSTREWSVTVTGGTAVARRAARVIGMIALVDVAVILAIALTGGFNGQLGPIRISARDTFNPLQAMWILAALAMWLWWRPRVSARRKEGWPLERPWRALLIASTAFAVAAMPILWHGIRLIARDEYVTQRYFWRSAPKGVDVATLLLGNPFHGVWGRYVRNIYDRFGIDPIEFCAWLGIVPVVLVTWALVRRWKDPIVRNWTILGGVFFIWALGPHLMVLGRNTGMILPQTVLRYVPILANARVPGRAIVVSYLAIAVVSAFAAAEWRRRTARPALMLAALGTLVMADFAPAPFPVAEIDRPGIYDALRDRPEQGAVCELPVGIRDSFISRGFLDHRVLAYQAVHQRALVGGVVSRLSPSVVLAYETDPLVDALLRLSERDRGPTDAVPDRQAAADRLQKDGIAFIVLNRATAPPALVEYVERTLPLTLIEQNGERSLYVVAR